MVKHLLGNVILVVLVGLAPMVSVTAGGDGHNQSRSRLMVPDYVECDRNQLTSYFGRISDYVHENGYMQISISTDYGTEESLALKFADDKSLMKYMYLNGEPFSKEGWKTIESAKNKINQHVKVIAWICSKKEFTPIIDWKVTKS